MRSGKCFVHWIADAAAVAGGAVLGLVAQGAVSLGHTPLTVVAVVTALALKFSRSPVASAPEGQGK